MSKSRRRSKITIACGCCLAINPALCAAEPSPERSIVSNSHFLQYGVAIVSENVASAGDVCPSGAAVPCIIGSGFGATIRVGYRTRGPWYLGGAYEFSHHDSSNLLRLAILQQARGEARFYLDQGTRLTPYFSSAAGAMIYGNEWGLESGGPLLGLGSGVEYQAGDSAVIGLAINWRGLLFGKWKDSAGQARADRYLGLGLGHLIALEFILEVRDPLPRW